jgi:hypothetical protein
MSALEFDLLIRMGLTHEEISCASEPGPWGLAAKRSCAKHLQFAEKHLRLHSLNSAPAGLRALQTAEEYT